MIDINLFFYEENHENLSQDSGLLSQDLNRVPPSYKSWAVMLLTTWLLIYSYVVFVQSR
jgi:hypothetical protein